MPVVYSDAIKGEKRLGTDVPSSRSSVLTEQFAQTFEENPIKAFNRWNSLRADERTGPALDAASARQKLKDAGFDAHLKVNDAGITQAALDTLMERKRIELRRQDVFARAQGGAGEFTQRLGLSIATTLADPISMGLNFVPIVGQTRYARWLAGAGSTAGRIGVRAGAGALEGAAGAAIAEPFIYGMRTQEQADYDMGDSLLNVALGGITGSGLHTLVGTTGELLNRRLARGEAPARVEPRAVEPTRAPEPLPTDIQRTIFQEPVASPLGATERAIDSLPSHIRETALRAAVGQTVEGRAIDVETLIDAGSPHARASFETARGSVYSIEDDGTTVRDKAPGHEDGGVGIQKRSDSTFYVTDADARLLAEVQTIGPVRRAVERIGEDRAGVQYREGKDAGRFEKRTVVPIQKSPAVGLTPVETWRDGSVHFGNAITKVTPARPRATSSTAPATDHSVRTMSEQADEILSYESEPKPGMSDIESRADAANDEATLAVADAKAAMKRLGHEFDEDAIAENMEKAERWARVAELATVCLVRGD